MATQIQNKAEFLNMGDQPEQAECNATHLQVARPSLNRSTSSSLTQPLHMRFVAPFGTVIMSHRLCACDNNIMPIRFAIRTYGMQTHFP